MRYGNPSIKDKLAHLTELGCDRILLFPLYPQYAAATTATVNDKAFAKRLQAMRWQPALRTVPAYHDDPAYIDRAGHPRSKAHLATLDWTPRKGHRLLPRHSDELFQARATPTIATA